MLSRSIFRYGVIFFTYSFLLQGFLFGTTTLIKTDSFEEQLFPFETHERCFQLRPGEQFYYNFESSGPLTQDLHSHHGDKVHTHQQQSNVTKSYQNFDAPEAGSYCLLWYNPKLSMVKLQYQLTLQKVSSESDPQVSIRMSLSQDRKGLILKTLEGKLLRPISIGHEIYHYLVNPEGTLLIFLTKTMEHRILIYDLQHQKVVKRFRDSHAFNLAQFSKSGRYLLLARERHRGLYRIDMQDFRSKYLSKTPPVWGVELPEKSEHFWIRNQDEVILMDWEDLKILEKESSIPIVVDGEEHWINPKMWCFVHGVPHPLFAPSPDILSQEGLIISIDAQALPLLSPDTRTN